MKRSIFQIKNLHIVINCPIVAKRLQSQPGAYSWHDAFDTRAGLDLTACFATLMSQIFPHPSMHRNLLYCRVLSPEKEDY